MAKVIMPLASAGARGQLAKIMVFFPWKSINVVRGYVIPSNPNSAGQQAQRTKLTNAVAEWHATPLIAADKTAWDLFATIFAEVMSGFNSFVKKWIDALIAGHTWKRVYNRIYTSLGGGNATVTVDTTSTTSKLKLKLGTSKTFMPTIVTAAAIGSPQSFSLTGLVTGVTYFYQVYTNELGHDCWTGIYRVTYS